jgi:transcription termination/antitermination protein NusG
MQEKQWYVVQTKVGHEDKVKAGIISRAELAGIAEKVSRVLSPGNNNIRKNPSNRKIFPGYLLIEMVMDNQTYGFVRNSPGVKGFVGDIANPVPLSQPEVDRILGQIDPQKLPAIELETGDQVVVVAGAFKNFVGVVDGVYPEKKKLKVIISMFGRDTPIEAEFGQVQKA